MTITEQDVSTCRSCGAPIIWCVTDRGRRMPVDAEGHERGNLRIWRIENQLVVKVTGPDPNIVRHRPHFATCPDAATWRRPKPE